MYIYSATKGNIFESVLMRWMNIQPIIQSEVSQKEKYQYSMLLLLLSHFSHVRLFPIPWTAAYQAPPSMGLSRQEYWSGMPLPSPMHPCYSSHLSHPLLPLPQSTINCFIYLCFFCCLAYRVIVTIFLNSIYIR